MPRHPQLDVVGDLRTAHGFNHRPNITAGLVWVNLDAVTAPDEIDDGVPDSDADPSSSAPPESIERACAMTVGDAAGP